MYRSDKAHLVLTEIRVKKMGRVKVFNYCTMKNHLFLFFYSLKFQQFTIKIMATSHLIVHLRSESNKLNVLKLLDIVNCCVFFIRSIIHCCIPTLISH